MIGWWFTEIGEGEKRRLMDAFDQRKFSLGSIGRELEERLAKMHSARHAVVTPSGTAALAMSMSALGVGRGDEVIVPTLTWIASAQAASMLGADVVLVDSCADLPLIDPDGVERAITPRTKAIVPVHFHGRSCDMVRLKAIADKHNLAIVEDACKSMYCASPQGYLGTIGNAGCFSLGMISLISAGYGGFALTNDDDLCRRMRLVRDHGVKRVPEDVYEFDGFNFKISDLLCAVALGQLDRLEEKLSHLHAVHRRYVEGLDGQSTVHLIPVDVAGGMVPLCVDLLTEDRLGLERYLLENGVQISRFHPPLHHAHYYTGHADQFPHAERFADQGFMPPCGPSQPLANVDRAIELVRRWIDGRK